MAKKAELVEQAQKLKLDVSAKNTIAELEAAIEQSKDLRSEVSEEKNLSSKNEDLPSDDKVVTAKAGKRSAKALKEVEEKEAKEERKEKVAAGELDPSAEGIKKGPSPKTRSRLERRSKGYKKVAELIDSEKEYTLKEASEILPKTSTVKFDASVELHVNLGVDPRQADQNIRATVALPHGTGKSIKIAVFAPADQHEAAKAAGADIVGEDEFLQQLDKEQLDFDVLIATPQLMAKLGKYARILGPRGLMPNPKSGTVTAKVADAVKEAKAGKVEFRVDKQSIVHLAVGKVSFTPQQIAENAHVVLKALADAKPGSVKGTYMRKVTMTTTMGPSMTIALSEV
ncbi:50S ribosomal protein L1 [Candidatus Saccharibacteria bacterium]|nr:50S ribosomal protein L1 [Candidatus Saccharibacteria bacterium]